TGAMLGNTVWYLAARALGVDRLRPFIRRHGKWLTLNWSEVERAEHWFALHGAAFVFLARMLPTVRSLVSIPAGLLRMRFKHFFIASTLGTAGWTLLLATAGYKLQENVGEVEQFIGPVANAVIIVLAAGYVWRLLTHKNDPVDDRKSSEKD
ncbi:MAG TPA: DedA family protein, partial [Sphingomicrobium sp.]